MRLSEALKVFLSRYTNEQTIKVYRGMLSAFIEHVGDMDCRAVTPVQVQGFVSSLQHQRKKYDTHSKRPTENKPLSPSTIRKNVKALRTFFNWLIELELLEKSPVKKMRLEAAQNNQRVATTDEMERLIRAAYGDPVLYAMVLFFADTAARREGVGNLRISDLDMAEGSAIVDEKFSKTRKVWFGSECKAAIQKYLEKRPNVDHDYVFCTRNAPHDPYKIETISQLIYRLAKKAEIKGAFGPHAIRRWRLDELKHHTDDKTRAAIAGHADNGETLRKHYTFTDDQEAAAVVKRTAWKSKRSSQKPNVINFSDYRTG